MDTEPRPSSLLECGILVSDRFAWRALVPLDQDASHEIPNAQPGAADLHAQLGNLSVTQDLRETSLRLHSACMAGSLQEREAGFQELGKLLCSVAWRRVSGNPKLEELAADCMQEALLVIWRCLEDDRGPSDPERFVGWCCAIVLNKLREELRRIEPKTRSRRSKRVALSKQTSLERSSHPDGRSLAASLADEAPELDEDQAYREIRELVQEISTIAAISENSRTVLLKGFIEDWDDAELAAHLNTSRANVHVIRSRDLAKLREAGDYQERLKEHAP